MYEYKKKILVLIDNGLRLKIITIMDYQKQTAISIGECGFSYTIEN